MTDEWSKKPRIAVSRDLKERLDELRGASETYEDALRRLLERAEGSMGSSPRLTDRNIERNMIRCNYISEGDPRTVKKTVREGGNSGRIYLPRAWIGEEVLAVSLDDGKEDVKTK